MKKVLLFALLLCSFLPLQAQSREIKGIVLAKSDQAPIPGVNVIIKNTTTGTSTNEKGEFTLLASGSDVTLIISFIGYLTQEIVVEKSQSFVKVELIEDIRSLSEVVVTGYGVSTKSSVTGAISTISGRAAGVRVRGRAKSKAPTKTPIIETEAADAVTVDGPLGRARVLTAGELHDFSKWKLWEDISANDLSEWQKHWQITALERYSLQVLSTDGFPIVDAPIFLEDERGAILFKAKTDNTGKAELWKGLISTTHSQSLTITASIDGKTHQITQPKPFHQGVNILKVNRPCRISQLVDIAFVVDATGSMADEINFLQAELNDVIAKVKDSLPETTVNLGSVFYRDHGDEYVTRVSPLSDNIETTINFIKRQGAGGGGDTPEAVDQALEVALNNLSWSKEAKARLLFFILDAPPHYNKPVLDSMHQLILKAAAQGIRIIPIAASGIDKSTEYLMRAMALATNGTYLFLTDDSGVGNPHIKPTTDKYEVELLNSLLIKVISKFTQVNTCEQAWKAFMSVKDTVTDTIVNTSTFVSDSTSVTIANARKDAEIDEQSETYKWKYYPNPTSEAIHIEADKGTKEIFITDVTGKIIIRKELQEKPTRISMLDYPNGIYFIRLNTGKKWETAKFLVSR